MGSKSAFGRSDFGKFVNQSGFGTIGALPATLGVINAIDTITGGYLEKQGFSGAIGDNPLDFWDATFQKPQRDAAKKEKAAAQEAERLATEQQRMLEEESTASRKDVQTMSELTRQASANRRMRTFMSGSSNSDEDMLSVLLNLVGEKKKTLLLTKVRSR